MKSKCSDLEATIIGLIQEVEKNWAFNEILNKSLQDVHVDLLSSSDETFERTKAQAVCIMPDLDMSKMDFFKTVVDGQLIDIEEASHKAEVLKDVMTNNPTIGAQDDKHNDA